MSFEAIKKDIKARKWAPVYCFCGEETYYIDELTNLIMENALTEAERDFNQHVFYAKDSDPQEVVNTARKYPVFAERQLVVVKEAQHFRKWDALEAYIKQPVPSTILVLAHMHKNIDLRTGFGKTVKKQHVYLKANKVKDYQVPKWIATYLAQQGKTMDAKSSALLLEHLGNDLSKIANELNKVVLNIGEKRAITPEHIEKYIGISKDFNAFELSAAVASRDYARAMNIIHYFEKNPKAGPMVFVLTVLYNFFSKIYQLQLNRGMADSDAAKLIRVPHFYFKDYKQGMANYPLRKTESIIADLARYDAKAKGIGNTGAIGPYELLKELLFRIMKA